MNLALLAKSVLNAIFPRLCAHCRGDLPRHWKEPLCAPCGAGLVSLEPPYCRRCAEPLAFGLIECSRCDRLIKQSVAHCDRIRACVLYRGPAASLVRAFKYRQARGGARYAGALMARHLSRFPELSGCHALVPMPLHPRRRRFRGYNQAELLADEITRASGIPLANTLLERTRATRPQWTLSAPSRAANLAEAIRVRPGASVAGLRLLLIDDVCTTGASFEACARALKAAGALRVDGYAFAREPKLARPVNL